MRVHDVGSEAPRRADGIAGEREMSSPSTGALIDHRALQIMPASREFPLEVGDEDSEVGVVRAGIHLRDEEDLHRWINRDCSGSHS